MATTMNAPTMGEVVDDLFALSLAQKTALFVKEEGVLGKLIAYALHMAQLADPGQLRALIETSANVDEMLDRLDMTKFTSPEN